MTLPSELAAINGAHELHNWFGYWPDFHDAEILRLYLNRTGESSFAIHTWEMTKELDERGYFVLAKHVVVEFILGGISDLALADFSEQNVISRLDIEKLGEGNNFRLTIAPCYGLAGTIDARSITIRLHPGKP